ncbi:MULTISPECIES: hypothetical protein [Mycobacteriaceae]|uniref:hypothetical protein n=1 Tax=Mycobacteriaceae TaxID=1762 RepID=UPI000929E6A9|nr:MULTISPECIES: hypothetical protein [Mycobacteriaceae]SIN56540.1 Uncharacterised protein [Mycobacteroides abscessus subsp. abscessus]
MIPTVRVGDTLVFSDTYARFAAGLMSDAGHELVKITRELDRDLMSAGRAANDPQRFLVQDLQVDAPALIVAANYCHWVSDHILDEIARIRVADLTMGEQWTAFLGDADHAALFRSERHEALPDTTPPHEPPPFPAALKTLYRARRHWFSVADELKEIDEERGEDRHRRLQRVLAVTTETRYARRIESIRETLAEARSAIVRNRTGKTDVLVQHVDALSTWAAGSS